MVDRSFQLPGAPTGFGIFGGDRFTGIGMVGVSVAGELDVGAIGENVVDAVVVEGDAVNGSTGIRIVEAFVAGVLDVGAIGVKAEVRAHESILVLPEGNSGWPQPWLVAVRRDGAVRSPSRSGKARRRRLQPLACASLRHCQEYDFTIKPRAVP